MENEVHTSTACTVLVGHFDIIFTEILPNLTVQAMENSKLLICLKQRSKKKNTYRFHSNEDVYYNNVQYNWKVFYIEFICIRTEELPLKFADLFD